MSRCVARKFHRSRVRRIVHKERRDVLATNIPVGEILVRSEPEMRWRQRGYELRRTGVRIRARLVQQSGTGHYYAGELLECTQ